MPVSTDSGQTLVLCGGLCAGFCARQASELSCDKDMNMVVYRWNKLQVVRHVAMSGDAKYNKKVGDLIQAVRLGTASKQV